MVRQGDIVKLCIAPQKGHEQSGFRPAVVVSNDFFNQKTNLTIVCPITNTNNQFPLHVPLDNRTQTTGVILCEHVRALDLNARPYTIIEQLPKDILTKVINIIFCEIKEIEKN